MLANHCASVAATAALQHKPISCHWQAPHHTTQTLDRKLCVAPQRFESKTSIQLILWEVLLTRDVMLARRASAPTLMRSLFNLTPNFPSASSVWYTQLYATSLAAMLVRTMWGMVYLALRAWQDLLVRRTTLPLLRNKQLGILQDSTRSRCGTGSIKALKVELILSGLTAGLLLGGGCSKRTSARLAWHGLAIHHTQCSKPTTQS
eukprot:GHUV01036164.1.p1 GENE.GHUV01036164.1~~GHUV01036164.1.p1  ORF type:complete len:205 (+),score=14.22 GHUV01036164.1:379-993(+)